MSEIIEKTKNSMKKLRNDSGNIQIKSKLVSFLYQLMRDHVPTGIIEKIVIDSDDPDVTYTNGWLAKYAENIANRLMSEEEE